MGENERSWAMKGPKIHERIDNKLHIKDRPNVGTANGERFEILRFFVLQRHLNGLEMSVHGDVDAGDCAVNLRPIFQFNRNSLVTQFHQKAY